MKRRRAQALVEFAFVFPIFLLLVLVLLDLGRAVWQYNTLADVARQAAHQRELGAMSIDPTFCEQLSTKLCQFTTVVSPPPADTVQIALTACTPGALPSDPPLVLPTIIASYAFQPVVAFLGGAPIQLTATALALPVSGGCQ
jgi:hypothetical protein